MKTQTKLTLKFVEDALTDLLQATLQNLHPLVRCRLDPMAQLRREQMGQPRSGAIALKIFIQHQHTESASRRVRRVLQQVLQLSYTLIRQSRGSESELSAVQQIHVLLFVPGEKTPYAKRTVGLADASGMLQSHGEGASLISEIPSSPVPVVSPRPVVSVAPPRQRSTDGAFQTSHVAQRDSISNQPASKGQPLSEQSSTPSSPAEHVRDQSSTDLSSVHQPSTNSASTNQPSTALSPADPLPADRSQSSQTATASRSSQTPYFWNRWNILKATAAGVIVTLTGMGTYALTRPCVVGTCEVIHTAQALNQESKQLLNTASTPGEVITPEEVVTAYENLVEANFQLARIPFWSKYYDVAQALLSQYQEEADFVAQIVTAQRRAYEATLSAQEAPHPLPVWEDIRGQWQEAIAQLSTVPPDAGVTPLAATKLSEYQQYLSDIDQQINQERAAQAKITEARQVAQIAEARESSATSAESWQQVYVTWQVVIDRLADVPKETMAYAEAQQLNALYSDRLAVSQERHHAEQRSQMAYIEATALADEALQHEQDGQLTQALVAWQNALTNVEQIAEDTSYYDQAQPLLSSYREELVRTEDALGALANLEDYRPLLNRACTASSPVCTYILEPDGIQIMMADAYAEGLRQFLTAGITTEASDVRPSEESPQLLKITSLLQAISTIGDDGQVAIELFDSENQLIATYEPGEGGYVQANSGR